MNRTVLYLSQSPLSSNAMDFVTWLDMVQALQGALSHPYGLSHRSQGESTQLWLAGYPEEEALKPLYREETNIPTHPGNHTVRYFIALRVVFSPSIMHDQWVFRSIIGNIHFTIIVIQVIQVIPPHVWQPVHNTPPMIAILHYCWTV